MKKRLNEVLVVLLAIATIIACLFIAFFEVYLKYKVVKKVILDDNNVSTTAVVEDSVKIVPNAEIEPLTEVPDLPLNIIIPGYFGQTREEDVLIFSNPEANGCNLIFRVYSDTVTIWQSDPVSPGECAEWTPNLEQGIYNFKLEITGQTFSGAELSGADGNITIVR